MEGGAGRNGFHRARGLPRARRWLVSSYNPPVLFVYVAGRLKCLIFLFACISRLNYGQCQTTNLAPIALVPVVSSQTADVLTPPGEATVSSREAHAKGRGPDLHLEVPETESESEESEVDSTDSSYITASESESEESDEEQTEEARQEDRVA